MHIWGKPPPGSQFQLITIFIFHFIHQRIMSRQWLYKSPLCMSSEKDSQQNNHCDNKFCTAQVQVTGFGMLLYFIWTMTIVSQYYDSCHFTDGAQKRRSRLPKVTLPVKKKCYMQTQVLWLQSPGSCIHSATVPWNTKDSVGSNTALGSWECHLQQEAES